MASGQSGVAVLSAVAAGAAITLTKFLAAAFGGSAAMLAEGIHSAVDTANNLLLCLGLRRSARPADEKHPFGYGQELYFWSLVVALVIFTVAGGVTIAEGVARILRPSRPEALGWSYAVLAAALVFNSYSWAVALREFLAGKGNSTLWHALAKAKDPTVLTVLFEDTASLLGVPIAFLGLLLADRLDWPELDGLASVVIGALMALVALGLVYQCKTLLVGESVNRDVQDSLRTQLEADAAVAKVDELLTLHLAPEQVLLSARVRFRDGLSVREVAEAVQRLNRSVREKHPEVKWAWLEPGPPAAAGGTRHSPASRGPEVNMSDERQDSIRQGVGVPPESRVGQEAVREKQKHAKEAQMNAQLGTGLEGERRA